jgi:hypothetical protein
MKKNLNISALYLLFLAGLLITSCSISYSFTGSSVDYTKVSSISIKDFPNMAPLVYAPLSQQFTEALKDKYTRQTKLQVLRDGGDYDLEGEISGYNFQSMAVKDGEFAAQTRLTITVRVRFTDNTDPEKDFERTFSAYSDFSNESTIDQVQDQLCEVIMKEIIDQIFNETVANW